MLLLVILFAIKLLAQVNIFKYKKIKYRGKRNKTMGILKKYNDYF